MFRQDTKVTGADGSGAAAGFGGSGLGADFATYMMVAAEIGRFCGATALTSLFTLLGKVLGERFQVQEQIGQGGSGTIYRAEHVTLWRARRLDHQSLLNRGVDRRS